MIPDNIENDLEKIMEIIHIKNNSKNLNLIKKPLLKTMNIIILNKKHFKYTRQKLLFLT